MAAPTIILIREGDSTGAILAAGGIAVVGLGVVGAVAYFALQSGVMGVFVSRNKADLDNYPNSQGQAGVNVYVDGTKVAVTDASGYAEVRTTTGNHDFQFDYLDPTTLHYWYAKALGVPVQNPSTLKQGEDDQPILHFDKWIMYRLFPKAPVLLTTITDMGTSGLALRARDRGNIDGPFAGQYLPGVRFGLYGPRDPLGQYPTTHRAEATSAADGSFGWEGISTGRYAVRVLSSEAIPHEVQGALRILKHEKFQGVGAGVSLDQLEYDIVLGGTITDVGGGRTIWVEDVLLFETAIEKTTGTPRQLTANVYVSPPGTYIITIWGGNGSYTQKAGATTDSAGRAILTFQGIEGLPYEVRAVSADALRSGVVDHVFWDPVEGGQKRVDVTASDAVALTLNIMLRYPSGEAPEEADVRVENPGGAGAGYAASGRTQARQLALQWVGTRTAYKVLAQTTSGVFSDIRWVDFSPYVTGPQTKGVEMLMHKGGGGGNGGGGKDPPPENQFLPYWVEPSGALHLRW